MNRAQKQVEDFHRALDIPIGDGPEIRRGRLRASLILEEAIEAACAMVGFEQADDIARVLLARQSARADQKPDLAEAIDGLCDTIVVAYGAAVEFGVDLEPFYDEVMRTNMEKAGGPVREDGKRLKPPGWEPPKIREMLAGGAGSRKPCGKTYSCLGESWTCALPSGHGEWCRPSSTRIAR